MGPLFRSNVNNDGHHKRRNAQWSGLIRIQSQLRAGKGMLAVAKALGVGTSTVQRIAREIEAARPFDGVSGRRVKALA
jgi:hypothetical protein